MAMGSLNSQWNRICLLLFLATVASAIDVRDMNIDEYLNYINPPAVHKFQNEYGDTILCVLYTDQISLQGSEQWSMETRDDRKTKPGQNFSSYDVKAGCPEDTVAIMETKREHVETAGSVKHFISNGKDIRHSAQNRSSYEKFNVADYHEWAAAQFVTDQPIHGASAGLNLWQPHVDIKGGGIFSLCQIWVINDQGTLEETMEAGWIVGQNSEPRFFTFWTADGYKKTGCYNTNCPGFVLAPGAPMYLGLPLQPLSTYNGEQRMVNIKFMKETPTSGGIRWSLYVNSRLIGWWPGSLFKNLQSNANRVDFGGEVSFNPRPSGSRFSRTEMGSGHFPSEGFRRSAKIWDIKITNDHGVPLNINARNTGSRPQCYSVSRVLQTLVGKHIFFGGPGGNNPNCVF